VRYGSVIITDLNPTSGKKNSVNGTLNFQNSKFCPLDANFKKVTKIIAGSDKDLGPDPI